MGFKLTNQSKYENGKLNGFEFMSGVKAEDKVEVVNSELELLEYIRLTETIEELDTLTV